MRRGVPYAPLPSSPLLALFNLSANPAEVREGGREGGREAKASGETWRRCVAVSAKPALEGGREGEDDIKSFRPSGGEEGGTITFRRKGIKCRPVTVRRADRRRESWEWTGKGRGGEGKGHQRGEKAFCPASDFFFRYSVLPDVSGVMGSAWLTCHGDPAESARLVRRRRPCCHTHPPLISPTFNFAGRTRALSLAFRVASTSSSSNEFGRHALCSDDIGRIFIHSFTTHIRYVRVLIFRCVPAPAIDGIRSAQRGENRSVLLKLWIRAIFKVNGKKWLNFPMESRNQFASIGSRSREKIEELTCMFVFLWSITYCTLNRNCLSKQEK